MKKIVWILIIALTLMGCNSDPTKKSSYDERLYFVFATPLKEHEVWLKAKEGFDDACKEKKIHGDWIGPIAIDTQKMEEVIETAIFQKADAIITQGVIDSSLINKAKYLSYWLILMLRKVKDLHIWEKILMNKLSYF